MLTLLRILAGKGVWLALSFVLVVAVLAIGGWLRSGSQEYVAQAGNTQAVAAVLDGERARFAQRGQAAVEQSNAQIARIRTASVAQLGQAKATIAREQAAARALVLDNAGLAMATVRGDSAAVIASYRAQYLTLPLLTRAENLVDARLNNIKVTSLAQDLARHERAVRAFSAASAERDRRARRAEAQTRNIVCREAVGLPGCGLAQDVARRTAELERTRARLEADAKLLRLRRETQAGLQRVSEDVVEGQAILSRAVAAYRAQAQQTKARAETYAVARSRSALAEHGWSAVKILALAILLPILFKLLAFFVVAPIVARSVPIRLCAPGPPLTASRSALSLSIPVGPADEVLLRAGLQSSAADVRGGDKLLLDGAMPLTCLAAGLVNLQRLRSDRPDHLVVTGRDEHHHLAAVTIPAGGAAVLQPRALLGVARPRDRRLVITRPWQAHRLVAWLTLQLRYVVFHGPCTLIVEGRDGVLVEDASAGRMINRRLTLGFDAGIDYGTERSASFLPFFLGRASLFNDRFAGEGRYLYEQRASQAKGGSIWGRGLKGLGDGVLKVFGI